MGYSISQVARRFGIEAHTLRFYEKEGIIEPDRTKSGVRIYYDEHIGQLEMAMCLKETGMSLKDIKRYFALVKLGDDTLLERLEIFMNRRKHVLEEIEVLNRHLCKIENKISRYRAYVERRLSVDETNDKNRDQETFSVCEEKIFKGSN